MAEHYSFVRPSIAHADKFGFLLNLFSIFIRICTTGEAPVDPPEEMANAVRQHQKERPTKTKKKQTKKQCEPDRIDDLNDELKTLQYNDDDKQDGEEKAFEEVSNENEGNSDEKVQEIAMTKDENEVEEKTEGTAETNVPEGEDSGDTEGDDDAGKDPQWLYVKMHYTICYGQLFRSQDTQ